MIKERTLEEKILKIATNDISKPKPELDFLYGRYGDAYLKEMHLLVNKGFITCHEYRGRLYIDGITDNGRKYLANLETSS